LTSSKSHLYYLLSARQMFVCLIHKAASIARRDKNNSRFRYDPYNWAMQTSRSVDWCCCMCSPKIADEYPLTEMVQRC
jgi:hypothetical protein